MTIIKIIFEIILLCVKYFVGFIGLGISTYIFIGALYFWSSTFATEDDTFIKCIKKSWEYAKEGKPWYKS